MENWFTIRLGGEKLNKFMLIRLTESDKLFFKVTNHVFN